MFSRAKRFSSPKRESDPNYCERCEQKHLQGATPKPCKSKGLWHTQSFSHPRKVSIASGSVSNSSLPAYESAESSPCPEDKSETQMKAAKTKKTPRKSSKLRPSIDSIYISTALLKIEQRLKQQQEKQVSPREVVKTIEKFTAEADEKKAVLVGKIQELEQMYESCVEEAKNIEETCKKYQLDGQASSVQESDLVGFCTSIIEDLCLKIVEAELKNRSHFSFKKLFKKVTTPFKKLLYVLRNLDKIEIPINN